MRECENAGMLEWKKGVNALMEEMLECENA